MPIIEQTDRIFMAYGFGDDAPQMDKVILRKMGDDQFLADLASCKAVITNGGYSLISEALYLGKPVYSVPTRRDFEQMLNAFYVQELGYGLYDLVPSPETFNLLLNQADSFAERLRLHKDSFCANETLFQSVDARIAAMEKGRKIGKFHTAKFPVTQ